MVEDAAPGAVEVVGVDEVEGEAGDSDIQHILHMYFQHTHFSIFEKNHYSANFIKMNLCEAVFSI